MKTKFTPGPWIAAGNSVLAADGPTIAKAQLSGGHGHKFPKGQPEANAQLIAYAPDMFELLEKLADPDNKPEDYWRLAGAAKFYLKKLEGE